MDDYITFWKQPSQVEMVWVAMLFGILRVAATNWHRHDDEPSELQGKCEDLAILYRQNAIQCLAGVELEVQQESLVEALLLQCYADYATSGDFISSVWVLQSVILRICMRMGYHVDGRTLHDISCFQAEMRRRIWTFVRQADIMFSFQIGLPSMVPSRWLDGALPSNLHDEDFGRHSEQLPEALPDSETTKISYLRSKSRLSFGFAKALATIEHPDITSYDQVLALDREIRSIYRSIPPYWSTNGVPKEPIHDPLLAGSRLTLANVYHKAICVLHSRHLKAAASDNQYMYSRLACLDAAMALLAAQAFQHRKFTIRSRTVQLTKFQTSITRHDYFIAATMLCTALFVDQSTKETSLVVNSGPSREDMLNALEQSRSIFADVGGESVEARRACHLLRALLHELRSPQDDERNAHTIHRKPSKPVPVRAGGELPCADDSTGTTQSSQLFEPSITPPDTEIPWQYDGYEGDTTMTWVSRTSIGSNDPMLMSLIG
jgi:hypothetical protein